MTTFAPAHDEIDSVLAVLADPTQSFQQVAEAFRTTAQALKSWLALPEVAAASDAMEEVLLRRTRLIAASVLPNVVLAVSRIVREYNAEADRQGEQSNATSSTDQKEEAKKKASRQAVLVAARLLIQLAAFMRATGPTARGNSRNPSALARAAGGVIET